MNNKKPSKVTITITDNAKGGARAGGRVRDDGSREGGRMSRKVGAKPRKKAKRNGGRADGCPNAPLPRSASYSIEANLRGLLDDLGVRLTGLAARIVALEEQKAPRPDLPTKWVGAPGNSDAIENLNDDHLLAIISKALRSPVPNAQRFAQLIAVAYETGRRGLLVDRLSDEDDYS